MKVKVSNWGKSEPEYESKYDWDCYCQAGSNGVVFSKNGNYETAFFEAFPKNPKCFIRGEGANIEEAEKKRQLREYAKSLFNAGDVGINLTYEEVE